MKLKNAADLNDLTMEQRESYARDLYNYESVTALIMTAATAGKGYVLLAQTLAASLRNRKATRQLVKKLKDAGYIIEWVEAVEKERSNGKETGGFVLYEELRISWSPVRIFSGPQVDPE